MYGSIRTQFGLNLCQNRWKQGLNDLFSDPSKIMYTVFVFIQTMSALSPKRLLKTPYIGLQSFFKVPKSYTHKFGKSKAFPFRNIHWPTPLKGPKNVWFVTRMLVKNHPQILRQMDGIHSSRWQKNGVSFRYPKIMRVLNLQRFMEELPANLCLVKYIELETAARCLGEKRCAKSWQVNFVRRKQPKQ